MLEKVDTIFPLFRKPEIATPGVGEASVSAAEWEKRTADTDNKESVLDWELREFHWRPAMTLEEFAEVHGLRIDTAFSTVGREYYKLTPRTTENVGGKNWDDGPYSMVVDEWKKVGFGPDPEINALRESIGKSTSGIPMTTEERQAIWLDYADRHHGERGYSGH